MKSKSIIIFIIGIIVLCAAFKWPSQSQNVLAQSQTRWEYKVIYRGLTFDEKNFNKLGEDGWEFVAVESEIVNGNSSAKRYIFKRLR